MAEIHPTAIIDRRAEFGDDVSVGAYAIIKGPVVLGRGTVVFEHSIIEGNTTTGEHCKLGPAAYIGLPPQHLKHDGAGTSVILGNHVTVRETAQIHRSITPGLEHATRLGDRCFVMAGAHVGHDCVLGEDVILANAVLLGGHCNIGNKVFLGGGATIHQFCSIGRLSIIGGNECFTHDVPPFAAVRYRGLKGYNAIGCKRSGMSRESIHAVRGAYYCLHANRTMPAAVAAIRETVELVPEVQEILKFIASSKRGILTSGRPRNSGQETGTVRDDVFD